MNQENPYDSPIEEREAVEAKAPTSFTTVARVVEYVIAILLIAGLFCMLVYGKLL